MLGVWSEANLEDASPPALWRTWIYCLCRFGWLRISLRCHNVPLGNVERGWNRARNSRFVLASCSGFNKKIEEWFGSRFRFAMSWVIWVSGAQKNELMAGDVLKSINLMPSIINVKRWHFSSDSTPRKLWWKAFFTSPGASCKPKEHINPRWWSTRRWCDATKFAIWLYFRLVKCKQDSFHPDTSTELRKVLTVWFRIWIPKFRTENNVPIVETCTQKNNIWC